MEADCPAGVAAILERYMGVGGMDNMGNWRGKEEGRDLGLRQASSSYLPTMAAAMGHLEQTLAMQYSIIKIH